MRLLDKQFGIDVSGQRTEGIDRLTGRRFDRVVTLCDKARERCPAFAHQPHRVHWSVPEPTATITRDRGGLPDFRQVAADIDTRVRHLLRILTSTDRSRRFQP